MQQSHRFCFFLELDRGTQDKKVIQDKIRGYLNCLDSGAYRRQYKTRCFSVLMVVSAGSAEEDTRRVGRLLSWVGEVCSSHGRQSDDLFLLSCLSQAASPDILRGPGMGGGRNDTGPFPSAQPV